MKKTLIFAFLLLAASVCLIVGADAYVSRQETAVTIDEYAIYGDSVAAAGLSFSVKAELDRHLIWDVEYVVGSDGITNLDFAYYDNEQQWPPRRYGTSVDLYLDNFDFGGGASGSSLSLDYTSEYIKAVASRTPDGQTHTEIVRVCDYYEYFPIMASVSYDDDYGRSLYPASEYMGSEDIFGDYFLIPVPQELMVSVTVTRSSYGSITEYRTDVVTEGDRYFYLAFNTCTAVAQNALFFTFGADTNDTFPIDVSHIKGGYGIYKLPLYPKEVAETLVFGSDISMVYPIDPETQRVMSLTASQDGSKLLLVTLEGGEYLLRVLDTHDMSVLQTLRLLACEEDYNHISLNIDNGVYLYSNSDYSFALVTYDESDGYRVAMTGDFGQLFELCDAAWRNSDQASIAYDGRRLAFVVPVTYYGPDTAVGVFTDGELSYIGIYDYSGFTGYAVQRRDRYNLDLDAAFAT